MVGFGAWETMVLMAQESPPVNRMRLASPFTPSLIARITAWLLVSGCADPVTIRPVRCSRDAQCDLRELCVESRCRPRDVVSCRRVEGGRPLLQARPHALDFGRLTEGSTTAELALRNVGDCTLTLFDIALARGSASPFTCDACTSEGLPRELFPLRELTVRIGVPDPPLGTFEDALVLVSDDAELPELRVPLRARFDGRALLGAAPARVELGFVPVGATGEATVRLTNRGSGTAEAEIVALRLEASEGAGLALGSPFTPRALAPLRSDGPQDALDVELRFSPRAVADHRGALVVTWRARGVETELRVPLQGSSRGPPRARISPDALRFGEVGVGEPTARAIVVANQGQSDLRVRPRWVGPGVPPDLALPRSALPPVEPGGLAELVVELNPTAEGPVTALLALETNDPTLAPSTVPVSADVRARPGAQTVRLELRFDNGSSSVLDDDFRDVDLILESPTGRLCDERHPAPDDWGAEGRPSWYGFGPKEEPERIVLFDAATEGTYQASVLYREDCASVPTDFVAAVLGLSVEALVTYLTGGLAGPSSAEVAEAIDGLCVSRGGTDATVTTWLNGHVVDETSLWLGARGDLRPAVQLVVAGGAISVRTP